MIDLRNASVANGTFTLFCEECEKRYGVPVEITIHVHQGGRSQKERKDRFVELHEKHDESGADLDARIESYLPSYDDKVAFATACYAEDPRMPFAEIQRRWVAFEEMKKETPERMGRPGAKQDNEQTPKSHSETRSQEVNHE